MQCMALDRYKITWVFVCLSVCPSVCPKYLSLSIATAVFVRSSQIWNEGQSHIWQWRASSMASNIGSSKRTCASIYFRFSSLLGLHLMKSSFNVKYLDNGDRYYDGANGSQIWNRSWAIDWHHDLWSWMTLNCPSSRSSKLHVKYFF